MTTTTEVPHKYPVAINGVGYKLDDESNEFRTQSIPKLKPQQDVSGEQGAASVNPENLWRSYQDSWHKGAGQTWLDKRDSDPFRFRSSKGIDVWTKNQISLLPATDQKVSLSNRSSLVRAGDYLYYYEHKATPVLKFTQDITADSPTWTNVTGLSTNFDAGGDVITDGFYIYTPHGVDGIYRTERGTTTSASWVTGTVNRIGYVKGRLMASDNTDVFNVTASGALPAALLSHPNTDWLWTTYAEGRNAIYLGGFSGNKSLIYRTAVKPDGTALDVPVVAGEMPPGERLERLYGYLGFILIGSDKGIRFARSVNEDGDLELGALIELGSTVWDFEGIGPYVWFTWTNYDGTSSGLGRLNLQTFTDVESLVPAYASDVMVTAQSQVYSIASFNDRMVFTLASNGVYADEGTTKVASGSLETGKITYGLHDQKIAHFLDVRFSGSTVGGTIDADLAPDSGTFADAGTHTGSGSDDPFELDNIQSETYEVRIGLSRGSPTTSSPVVTRYTLMSDVIAKSGYYIFLPLLITDDEAQYPEWRNLEDEVTTLKDLRTNGTVVEVQLGDETLDAKIEDYIWSPHHRGKGENAGGFTGTFLAKIKVVSG